MPSYRLNDYCFPHKTRSGKVWDERMIKQAGFQKAALATPSDT